MAKSHNLRQPALVVTLVHGPESDAFTYGMVGLKSRITLFLEAMKPNPPVPTLFAVDSGASCTLIPLDFAIRHHIPVPHPETEIPIHLTTTQGKALMHVRPGRIRAWWNPQQKGYTFDWPVLFQVGGSLATPPILGLGGVINTCRWTFEGGYSPDAPYGHVQLNDLR
jgi:hypothetical protein